MGDLLIKGAHLLEPDGPVRQADIRATDGVITEVGPRLAAGSAQVVDGEGMLAMPGLINAHTHSGQSLDRGTTPNLPLDLWLVWAVFASVARTPDDAYTTAAAGALEMLQTGCTAVLDHVYFPHDDPDAFDAHAEAVTSAYHDVGLRAGVAPMLGDLPFAQTIPTHLLSPADAAGLPDGPRFDAKSLGAMVDSFVATRKDTHPRVAPLLGPSALQRCSEEFLAAQCDTADRYGVGIHTHLLETKSQIFAGHHRWGCSTVQKARDCGLLRPGASLAHSVWVDSDDIANIAATGATAVHNPCSNLRLGSGVMPIVEMVNAGVPVAVGADGAASNDSQNMFETLKLAALLHTLVGDHRSWLTAEQVWATSLRSGAKALGAPVGRIAPGARADIVLLTLDRHVLAERHALVASLVFAENGQSVHTVITQGEVVLQDGNPTRVDAAEIGRRAREFQRRLHANGAERAALYEQWRPPLEAIEDAVADIDVGFERRVG